MGTTEKRIKAERENAEKFGNILKENSSSSDDIQNKILNPIASMIISKSILKGGVVYITVKAGELAFEIKKGRRGSIIEASILDAISSETVS